MVKLNGDIDININILKIKNYHKLLGGIDMKNLSKKNLLLISLMLFSMFFGAGNLIFPPLLGQLSGKNLVVSLIGFLVSAVCLPILAVAAVAKANGIQNLASRVNKNFALIFTILIYLSIGPFLGIPRAGSLAFEMSVKPFLPKALNASFLPLFIYTLCFFTIAFWLSINPSKLADRFGRVLTPAILILIVLIFAASLVKPIGRFSLPIGDYANFPFLKGFLDGYMTMDALAALNYGIVVSYILKDKGVKREEDLVSNTIKAGIIAGLFLTAIYLILSFLGACAQTKFGTLENGAQILTKVVFFLFNKNGLVILGLIFTLACLTTSVGLITSCSEYFSTLVPKLSYKACVTILSISSMLFANIGLANILKISMPVLSAIYPMAIVLILLPFAHNLFKGYKSVYSFAMLFTSIFSILDALNQAGVMIPLLKLMPLSSQGLAWVIPAFLGVIIGFLYNSLKNLCNKCKNGE